MTTSLASALARAVCVVRWASCPVLGNELPCHKRLARGGLPILSPSRQASPPFAAKGDLPSAAAMGMVPARSAWTFLKRALRPVAEPFELGTGDDHAVHGVGAVGQTQGAQARPHRRQRGILRDPCAAMHLDGFVDDF